MNGNYQIPIYSDEPFQQRPFLIETKMKELDRLPCASLLVRIKRAPMSRDGLKVLGIGDRPEREWRKLGIWEEQPDYKLGTYNT